MNQKDPGGIKYVSWDDTSGYAIAAREYLAALVHGGVPVSWTPMLPGTGWGRELYCEPHLGSRHEGDGLDSCCNAPIAYDTVILHIVPEYFPRWMEQEGPHRYFIGCTTWECDRLPANWPQILNRLDRIWVPSQWNRDVFERSGVVVPIDVVPHVFLPVDTTVDDGARTRLPGFPDDHYVFYCINTWTPRKGIEDLLETFWATFSCDEAVTLIVKTSACDETGWQTCWYRQLPLGHRVLKLLSRSDRSLRRLQRNGTHRANVVLMAEDNLPRSLIHDLHAVGDCFVSLTHAEGWGLGAFEAIAYANPVIMTGYGGQLDFLPAGDAYLVDYRLVPAPNGEPAQPSRWADPDLAHAGTVMRHVFENRSDASHRGQQLRSGAERRFTAQPVLELMIRSLRALHDTPARERPS